VRRRLVGGALRRYRENAGYTLQDVARVLECDRSKISRIETGQRGIRPRELRELLAEYGVPDREQAALVAIASRGGQRGKARIVAAPRDLGSLRDQSSVYTGERHHIAHCAERHQIEIATPLHDIGKIGVDDAILRKPGRLTAEELDERLELARRYLGPEGGDAYVTANPTGGQIVFRMTAEHWLTVDQSKVYG